ncbi:MAG: methyltransferase [Candidatus Sedimenticola sp. (ex Thyasira tokunagai)]
MTSISTVPDTAPEQHFTSPFGSLTLKRYPLQKRETLRAWDAADAYLLDELEVELDQRILIINDSFGALSCALAPFSPTMQSDSYISTWSTRENLRANGLDEASVKMLSSLDNLEGVYDLVLVRVTKTLALLEHELIQLKPHLNELSRVIGCGMVKQIHSSTLKLFEQIIGPTTTSLAKKKARLIHTQPDLSLTEVSSPYPKRYRLDETPYTLINHANVFSREKLDIGTRFLMQHLPATEGEGDIVDLGCGNGVLGLMVAAQNPETNLHFIDESYMAVASARETFSASGLKNSALFETGDCLGALSGESTDLILCNPPFHQQQAVGDAVAWRMFSQSRKVLRSGGELWVVGNRHLNYQVKLKHLFGNVEQVAENRKFVIFRSHK